MRVQRLPETGALVLELVEANELLSREAEDSLQIAVEAVQAIAELGVLLEALARLRGDALGEVRVQSSSELLHVVVQPLALALLLGDERGHGCLLALVPVLAPLALGPELRGEVVEALRRLEQLLPLGLQPQLLRPLLELQLGDGALALEIPLPQLGAVLLEPLHEMLLRLDLGQELLQPLPELLHPQLPLPISVLALLALGPDKLLQPVQLRHRRPVIQLRLLLRLLGAGAPQLPLQVPELPLQLPLQLAAALGAEVLELLRAQLELLQLLLAAGGRVSAGAQLLPELHELLLVLPVPALPLLLRLPELLEAALALRGLTFELPQLLAAQLQVPVQPRAEAPQLLPARAEVPAQLLLRVLQLLPQLAPLLAQLLADPAELLPVLLQVPPQLPLAAGELLLGLAQLDAVVLLQGELLLAAGAVLLEQLLQPALLLPLLATELRDLAAQLALSRANGLEGLVAVPLVAVQAVPHVLLHGRTALVQLVQQAAVALLVPQNGPLELSSKLLFQVLKGLLQQHALAFLLTELLTQ